MTKDTAINGAKGYAPQSILISLHHSPIVLLHFVEAPLLVNDDDTKRTGRKTLVIRCEMVSGLDKASYPYESPYWISQKRQSLLS